MVASLEKLIFRKLVDANDMLGDQTHKMARENKRFRGIILFISILGEQTGHPPLKERGAILH